MINISPKIVNTGLVLNLDPLTMTITSQIKLLIIRFYGLTAQ